MAADEDGMAWDRVDEREVLKDLRELQNRQHDAMHLLEEYGKRGATVEEPVQDRLDRYAREAREVEERYTPMPKVGVPEYHEDHRFQVVVCESIAKIRNHAYHLQELADAFPELEELEEQGPRYG